MDTLNEPVVSQTTEETTNMFTTSLIIHQNALQFGPIQVVMYGQLLESYTPAYGPQAGNVLNVNTWVCLTATAAGEPFDYTTTPAPGSTVQAFNTYTAAGTFSMQLPTVQIQAAHIVFLFGPGANVVTDSSGLPQQPIPTAQSGVYDFVEFTYNTSNVIYINTSMIDQFGMPICIQINPTESLLPAGAGVFMSRDEVFSNYLQFIQADSSRSAFAQCANDAFGNLSSARIVSPKTAVLDYGVAGVMLSLLNQGTNPPPSTLPAGTYYYAVCALNSSGASTYAQSYIASIQVSANTAVNIAWAGNSSQPLNTASYNVYRGCFINNELTWVCIANPAASSFTSGCATMDNGQATVSGQVALQFNPMSTLFDAEIKQFFAHYRSGQAQPKQLTLTATDGTNDGYVYTFSGNTVMTVDGNYDNYLSLLLTSVVQSNGTVVAHPPIPLNTAFNIYFPFWNTNTYNPNLQSPPAWAAYQNVPASVMVLAAEGVFADNSTQPVPAGADAAKYVVLLGALENQVVAAITRGIANLPANPQNWGNGTSPIQTAPSIEIGTTSLKPGQVYYYLLTASNANGESFAGLEFNMMTIAPNQCIQINWEAMPSSATFINVYRGTNSYAENELIAQVANIGAVPPTSYIDNGSTIKQASPPMYFPTGIPSSSYDQFFHLTSVSLNGAAYAGPYDDQGGQSSTLSTANPTATIITLGTI